MVNGLRPQKYEPMCSEEAADDDAHDSATSPRPRPRPHGGGKTASSAARKAWMHIVHKAPHRRSRSSDGQVPDFSYLGPEEQCAELTKVVRALRKERDAEARQHARARAKLHKLQEARPAPRPPTPHCPPIGCQHGAHSSRRDTTRARR